MMPETSSGQELVRLQKRLDHRSQELLDLLKGPIKLNEPRFIGTMFKFVLAHIQVLRVTAVEEQETRLAEDKKILDEVKADTTRVLAAIESLNGPDIDSPDDSSSE